MSQSDPLVVLNVTTAADTGKRVEVTCREPAPCLTGQLHGPSGVINMAVKRLELIHQFAHGVQIPEVPA
jgi:hypothetical protein